MAWGKDERRTLEQLETWEEKQGVMERFWEKWTTEAWGKPGWRRHCLLGQGLVATGWAEMWSCAMGVAREGLLGGGWAGSPEPGSSAPSSCPTSPCLSPSHLCCTPSLASYPALIHLQSRPCNEASGVGRADMKGESEKNKVKSVSLCRKIQSTALGTPALGSNMALGHCSWRGMSSSLVQTSCVRCLMLNTPLYSPCTSESLKIANILIKDAGEKIFYRNK